MSTGAMPSSSSPFFIYSLLLTSLVLLLIGPSVSFAAKCNPQDKKVLLAIKSALKGPNPLPSWGANYSGGCCEWYGIECDPITNRVVSLVIQYEVISGQIPPAIGDLPFLKTLIIRKLSNVSGEIPAAIAKLKSLTFVRLDYLNLTGHVPEFFSTLPNLTYLDLSFNNLSGPLPKSYYKIKGLGYLHLDRNKLTGPIPETYGLFSKDNPPYLSLAHNQLTGTIPPSFQSLNWQNIDLSRNKLEGDASLLFSSNQSWYRIDVSRNLLKFDLGKVKIPAGLVALDINHNSIYGKLPEALTTLELQSFNVSYNRLCGKIPVGGRLQSSYFDYSVYFHNRCLCGSPLPECK